jgi:ribosome-binding protein aMBF1 (putative translation factor)
MNSNNLITAKEFLEKEIGPEHSCIRERFRNEAYNYYLSEILKKRRKQLKWSQANLAGRLGKKRPYISRIEHGEDLRMSNFLQIAQELGLVFELIAIEAPKNL